MASFREILSTFSDDQNTRGDQFETLCKWILETDPIYTNKLKKVWMWDDWPGRWGPDAGIDLIAEDKEGKIWAIQAKCYNKIYRINKEDVNSFISESSNDQLDCRLLFATADKMLVHYLKQFYRPFSLLKRKNVYLKQFLMGLPCYYRYV